MATLLYRLGQLSARRRTLVLALWALLLAVLAGLSVGVSSRVPADTGFSIPGTEASAGLDVIGEKFSSGTDGATATVVFQAPDGEGLTGAHAEAVEGLLADLRGVDGVTSVTDPLDPQAPRVSDDGTIAASTVTFDATIGEVSDATTEAFDDVVQPAVDDGVGGAGGADGVGGADGADEVRVEVTSDLASTEGAGHASEAIGMAIALVVLVLTYGALVAAGANLLTAAVGVGVGLLGISVLGKVVSLSSTTPALASMLGLAVGIDYGLFVFARTRREMRRGATVEQAVATATATAGTAVAFAGTTVVIALVGLSVVDIPFLTEMGLAAAATVAVAVLVALTAVPALLAVMGRRVLPRKERSLDLAELRAAAAAQDADEAAATSEKAIAGPGPLGRWSRGVTQHPAIALVAAVVALGVVAAPLTSMRTALPSAENEDPASSARQAYDLLVEGFGEGSQSTLLVVVDGGAQTDGVARAAESVVQQVEGLDDVAAVAPPTPSADGTAQLVAVTPGSGPTDEATTQLVRDIREATHDVEGSTGTDVLVTGQTALDIDVTDALNDALPVYIALIAALALLLLVVLFRSIAVPLMATVGFLLSLGASLGSVVAIYQWGWLSDVFSVAQPAPLLSFMPVLVVGILFGLAMDYQMFLVSAIHEAHAHGRTPRHAVLAGFRQSAPVVVAAAAIMSGVFIGFATSGDAIIGSIGTALTVGVLADALVVRMVIMPAALALLGSAAWWMPRWMQRIVPNVDAEGRGLQQALSRDGTADTADTADTEAAPALPQPRQGGDELAPAVHGALEDARGRAIAGAVVTLTDAAGRQVARARTGADGGYALPLATGGTYLLIAAAADAQPFAARVAVADRPVHQDVRLTRTASLSGRVSARMSAGAPDGSGVATPVAGAVLTLLDARGEAVATARSAADGSYALGDLPGGEYVLSVLTDAYRPSARNVVLTGGAAQTHDLQLERSGRLAGTVAAASDGRPVPDASVTLTDAGGTVVGAARTDADGRYRFEDLGSGHYTLTAAGYAPVATAVQVADGGECQTHVRLGDGAPRVDPDLEDPDLEDPDTLLAVR